MGRLRHPGSAPVTSHSQPSFAVVARKITCLSWRPRSREARPNVQPRALQADVPRNHAARRARHVRSHRPVRTFRARRGRVAGHNPCRSRPRAGRVRVCVGQPLSRAPVAGLARSCRPLLSRGLPNGRTEIPRQHRIEEAGSQLVSSTELCGESRLDGHPGVRDSGPGAAARAPGGRQQPRRTSRGLPGKGDLDELLRSRVGAARAAPGEMAAARYFVTVSVPLTPRLSCPGREQNRTYEPAGRSTVSVAD